MQSFDYQKLIVAYHGCDQTIHDAVIVQGKRLSPSENTWDWLGRGI